MGNERWYRWYGASQAIASMLLVNGYWLLFNLPVLLLALGLIFPSSPRQFLFSLIGLIISFPSILLPATFALFGVMRRWLYYQETRQAIGGTFWRLYRENYRRSVAAGLFFGSLASANRFLSAPLIGCRLFVFKYHLAPVVTVFYLRQCAFGGTLADCVD